MNSAPTAVEPPAPQAVLTERQHRLDAVINPVSASDVWVHKKVLEGGRAFTSMEPHFSLG